jgi:hypothetical protein
MALSPSDGKTRADALDGQAGRMSYSLRSQFVNLSGRSEDHAGVVGQNIEFAVLILAKRGDVNIHFPAGMRCQIEKFDGPEVV